MCGIAGILSTTLSPAEAARRGAAMLEVMAHRGPDGQGSWADPRGAVWLGHRRLAIIDLEQGAQPMRSADGALVVSFNGCIYNYRELREELAALGHVFRTGSDTEVILAAYAEWGDGCLERFNGMWAFALWDARRRRMLCSRDRLGIKPFYWHVDAAAETVGFASEIKALFAAGLVRPERDPDGLRQYLTFQFCLGERTMFRGVSELPPGHNLVLEPGRPPVVSRYWDVAFEIDPRADDEEAVAERLRAVLDDAVRLRLRSDVPLGAHLSGGLDSSTVAGLARRHLPGGAPLHTFTGAFEAGEAFDERRWARLAAQAFGARCHEVVLGPRDFLDEIERILWHMDQPAAGPGVFPQFFVSRLASERVKVVLGGQGGDELFIGYARYLVAYLEECLKGAIEDTADRADYVVTLAGIVPSLKSLQNYLPMLRAFWKKGAFGDPALRYFHLMDRFGGAAPLLHPDLRIDQEATFEEFRAIFDVHGAASMINRILYFDLKTHLRSLLQVEDRTSMAFGLESRVPLLDYRLVELMASVPPRVKFRDGRLKHLFLRAVDGLVPEPIKQRRDKMGFPVPLAEWSRGPLRGALREIFGAKQARERGVFDTAALLEAIDGEASFGRTTWGALCLELWHRQFLDSAGRLGASVA